MGGHAVNRWRQRLDELRGDGAEPPHAVQNVQNVQNSLPTPAFEHFEQIEQPTEPPAAPPPLDRAAAIWRETEAPGGAMVEHGRAIPRAWAEGFARLDPDRPPGDVPPLRWQRFVDDIGHFLDSGFAGQAAALGWGPYDLFGCDRDRPFARIDKCGLLWLVVGCRPVAFSAEAAVIETRIGTRQTFRRKAAEPGRVLAWELVNSQNRSE
jgi:hypothetical protein